MTLTPAQIATWHHRVERLNDIAYIVPGLGDAGDRQFGPR